MFTATLSTLGSMLLIAVLGFLLIRTKVLKPEHTKPLSVLINTLFLPATIMSAFMEHFSLENVRTYVGLVVPAFVFFFFLIAMSYPLSRLFGPDKFGKNCAFYALTFSNYGFVGYPLIKALFSAEVYTEYLLFSLPLQFIGNAWAIPLLLMGRNEEEDNRRLSVKEVLRRLCNPIVIGMFAGIAYGLIREQVGFTTPAVLGNVMTFLGNCMAPVAMLITGMVVGGVNLKELVTTPRAWFASGLRLLVIPAVSLSVAFLLRALVPAVMSDICVFSIGVVACMPLGLNIVVVPNAFGRDTRKGAVMVLLSHILALVTVPLVFMFLSSQLSIG